MIMNHNTEKSVVRCANCGRTQYKFILERKHNMSKNYLDISEKNYKTLETIFADEEKEPSFTQITLFDDLISLSIFL